MFRLPSTVLDSFSMNFKFVHNINLEIFVKIFTQYLVLTKILTHFVYSKDCMISFYSAHCSAVETARIGVISERK